MLLLLCIFIVQFFVERALMSLRVARRNGNDEDSLRTSLKIKAILRLANWSLPSVARIWFHRPVPDRLVFKSSVACNVCDHVSRVHDENVAFRFRLTVFDIWSHIPLCFIHAQEQVGL